ncbi:aminoglycoside 6-adenylyltransferase [Streptomyces atratus]|uniref:aminoglycoside 6-adenylyltransferase n=1 Tax=Streptomyces atratus TaxID=1893 RepID=UPI00379BA7ED
MLLARILEWVGKDPRITGVVQTGSRARGLRVDQYSDLDIELIGPRWKELAAEDSWFHAVGDVLVALPFESEGAPDADPSWPTRLVVYAGGRKVDFTVAGEQRITRMISGGLDPLYDHGFVVHCDKTGLLGRLPSARVAPPLRPLPRQEEYQRTVTEFWFEASQVPVYVARDDLWVAQFRQNTMREMLLRMLEWFAQTDPENPRETWHIGHHMKEWLPEEHWMRVVETFGHLDAEDIMTAHRASMDLFEATSQEVARRLSFPEQRQLGARVRAAITQNF